MELWVSMFEYFRSTHPCSAQDVFDLLQSQLMSTKPADLKPISIMKLESWVASAADYVASPYGLIPESYGPPRFRNKREPEVGLRVHMTAEEVSSSYPSTCVKSSAGQAQLTSRW